jgi:hypothetical protein
VDDPFILEEPAEYSMQRLLKCGSRIESTERDEEKRKSKQRNGKCGWKERMKEKRSKEGKKVRKK